ncbi:hypothetical protein VNO77_25536 [Canavalia gladiata]|uniref:Uncharacterized protein n=1 Tax=Canavalia gladiata TaxID=3824 RepID=A0AAN9LBP2_CANGL
MERRNNFVCFRIALVVNVLSVVFIAICRCTVQEFWSLNRNALYYASCCYQITSSLPTISTAPAHTKCNAGRGAVSVVTCVDDSTQSRGLVQQGRGVKVLGVVRWLFAVVHLGPP